MHLQKETKETKRKAPFLRYLRYLLFKSCRPGEGDANRDRCLKFVPISAIRAEQEPTDRLDTNFTNLHESWTLFPFPIAGNTVAFYRGGMAEKPYVALLRGINVGGNNLIKMPLLTACLAGKSFKNVRTYIQSGNVLFTSSEKNIDRITRRMEEVLSKEFNYQSRVVIVSEDTLRAVVNQAPKGFGKKPLEYRYDVLFLKRPLTPAEAIQRLKVKQGVDAVYQGKDVIYFSRLIRKAAQSHLSRVVSLPIYQNMTIRNWNTTTKLLALMEAKD